MSAEPTAELLSNALTLRGALEQGTLRLRRAGVDSASLDAGVLLGHVLGLERGEMFLRLGDPLSLRDQKEFYQLLDRRAACEPLAYLTSHKEFWSLDFIVTPAVLIPRPETELLVELALDCASVLSRRERIRILDIGTGSGAIAVSLAKHLPESAIWAVDVSTTALRIAEANAKRHGVENRVEFLCGDLFDALDNAEAKFDVVVSNPPYIRRVELSGLAPEVRDWEPLRALDGGADGLDYYRRIIRAAPSHLNDDGRIMLEIGSDMAEPVIALFARAGCFAPAKVHRDYAGHDRVVAAVTGRRRG